MNRYVIVGNGVAGTTAAEQVRKLDQDGSITILTDEDFPFYWRIKLNEYLCGEMTEKSLLAKDEGWYESRRIELKLQTRVTGGDSKEHTVTSADNRTFSHDRLLIATGSHSFVPPIKGSDTQGVYALRSIKDARRIAAAAQEAQSVVLIGGGLLGLEAGNALRKLGKKVTVVEFFSWLLPRQLDGEGAQRLRAIMESMGFSFRLGAKTQEIIGDGKVSGVLLEGGETLPAQMVIVSAGVRPNLELAKPLGLEADKGIKVNERLQTTQEGIYAAGDVTEFRGMPPYGIWPAGMEQGKVAGINMAGGEGLYNGTTMANTLKVVGVDLASAGNIDAEGKFESLVVAGSDKAYTKIVLDNNQIIGCIMLGETKAFTQITKLMAEKRDVSAMKDMLLGEGADVKKM
jgi:nitrite reductase (NADH) large subunit